MSGARRSGLPGPAPDATALVTGASSGIGTEFARALAARGHALTLVARRGERLRALARELSSAHGVPVEWLSVDLTEPAQREYLHAHVIAAGRHVQVLVHSAGFGIYQPFLFSDRQRELAQVRLLIEAIVDLNSRFVAPMAERGQGAIVHLSSTAGFQPLPGNAGYSASKAFVLAHSEALGEELRRRGVTVTAVCPPPVPTEFFHVGRPLVVHRLPRALWCSAERVARDGLRAVERGALWVVPGSRLVRAFYTPYRSAPRTIAIPIARWMMAGELARMDATDRGDSSRVDEHMSRASAATDAGARPDGAGTDAGQPAPGPEPLELA